MLFGNYKKGKINVFKYEDVDGDKAYDANIDLVVDGWEFTLTGIDGMGNAVNQTDVTDVGGKLTFADLVPGEYTVSETPVAPWASSTPDSVDLTVLSGQTKKAEFGNLVLGSIHGVKYDDLNGNGDRDAGEPGVPDVTFELLDGNSDPFDPAVTTTTDADGEFAFEGLLPGDYKVKETLPADRDNSTSVKVSINGLVSRQEYVAYDGQAGLAVDDPRVEVFKKALAFGNHIPVQIHVFKYEDMNADNQFQVGEPAIAGWMMTLTGTDGKGKPVGPDVKWTDDGALVPDMLGWVWYEGLAPGEYTVCEEDPAGWNPSGPICHTEILESGDVWTIEFGNWQPAKIIGLKFHDLNGNGVQDVGEPSLQNWVLDMYDDPSQSSR